jgi:hypothetical protein
VLPPYCKEDVKNSRRFDSTGRFCGVSQIETKNFEKIYLNIPYKKELAGTRIPLLGSLCTGYKTSKAT